MFRQFINPPNWFTSANIFCGFYAIILLIQGGGDPENLHRAAILVIFAAIFDMLDGRVARLTGMGSDFGTQLDSLADIVSFGLAPALLVWEWALEPLGPVGVGLGFLFVLCGAFRLARFNLLTQDDAPPRSESLGITITVAGTSLAVVVMAATDLNWAAPPGRVGFLVAAFAMLMVSNVPYRTFKSLRLSPITVGGAGLFITFCVVVGLRTNLSLTLLILAVVYVLSGPVEGLLRLGGRLRLAGPDLSDDEEADLGDLPDFSDLPDLTDRDA